MVVDQDLSANVLFFFSEQFLPIINLHLENDCSPEFGSTVLIMFRWIEENVRNSQAVSLLLEVTFQ